MKAISNSNTGQVKSFVKSQPLFEIAARKCTWNFDFTSQDSKMSVASEKLSIIKSKIFLNKLQ